MDNYDDIINMPHHRSRVREPMSMTMRAAQFSSFAALTGHNAAIKETERLTDEKIELDEYAKAEINSKLQYIKEYVDKSLCIKVTYFISDERKSGGVYKTLSGEVTGLVNDEHKLILDREIQIDFDDILMLDGDMFQNDF